MSRGSVRPRKESGLLGDLEALQGCQMGSWGLPRGMCGAQGGTRIERG